MLHDIETTKDLLNFKVIADTAASLVHDSQGQPLSIGVSGSWGTGKSSLVKMIGESLKNSDSEENKYVFLEFNAWLYQGYDDARMALLQAVADKLLIEAENSKSHVKKAKEFVKRVNWLRIGKILVPTLSGAVLGGTVAGPLGAVIGALGGIFKTDTPPTQEDLEKVKNAYKDLQPELKGLLKEKESLSLPKEIQELRENFEDLLASLEVTLVVLVDDLDRCLSSTAISTLEAMRLLLFMHRTAFIIAADEQMIRGAVRIHFGDTDLGNELVTSYFDKLIQIPLKVPRLGVSEVKCYLILLLAELAEQKGKISRDTRISAESKILDKLRESWKNGLTQKIIKEAYGEEASKIDLEIDLADQLARIMVYAKGIAGNPRLIKRFLNDIIIRESIANAQNLSIAFDQLVKLQLFERSAPNSVFKYLAKQVAENEGGKAHFIAQIEKSLSKGESPKYPDKSFNDPFVMDWFELNPKLGDIDLRPLLYLSQDHSLSMSSFDELTSGGKSLLEGILESDSFMSPLVDKLKLLGETESEKILTQIRRKARANQWDRKFLIQAYHVPKAFPNLGLSYINLLNEISADKRSPSLIPLIRNEDWAKELLKQWETDMQSPLSVRNAITKVGEKL